MIRPARSSPSNSDSGHVWITSSNAGPTSPIVCQRSPSGCRSGFDAWNGSSNTRTAVSNDRPCLARFAAALSGSHVQRNAASFYNYKHVATFARGQGRIGSRGPRSRHQRVRLSPKPADLKCCFVRALKSRGKPSTEPMRSAMVSSAADRCRYEPVSVSLSRTTSDFDSLRRRDSAAILAARPSGRRTVNVFMA